MFRSVLFRLEIDTKRLIDGQSSRSQGHEFYDGIGTHVHASQHWMNMEYVVSSIRFLKLEVKVQGHREFCGIMAHSVINGYWPNILKLCHWFL